MELRRYAIANPSYAMYGRTFKVAMMYYCEADRLRKSVKSGGGVTAIIPEPNPAAATCPKSLEPRDRTPPVRPSPAASWRSPLAFADGAVGSATGLEPFG